VISHVLFAHPIHIKDPTIQHRFPVSIAPVVFFRVWEAKIVHLLNHFLATKEQCLVDMGRVVKCANPDCIKMKKVRERTRRHASIVRLVRNLSGSCCHAVFAPQIITKLKTMFLHLDVIIVRLGKRTSILCLLASIALLACTNQPQLQQLGWHANIVRLERDF
jgi:hypothetical protein|tara:strand:- start:902 stop:1390 length:489 start_codon:yes stop_codon:yes gene_type:complete